MACLRNEVANEQVPNVNELAQVMLEALAANIGQAPVGPRDELSDVVGRFRR